MFDLMKKEIQWHHIHPWTK